jgi:hypothetical protein
MTPPKPGSELPGMPERPKPPRSLNGREIEHAYIGIGGGVAFELRTQDAIDYLASFGLDDTVKLVVHGRVAGYGDGSQQIKDGTLLTRRVRIAVDYIEGAPNDEAVAAAAALAATKADDAEPVEAPAAE